jgi:hypothetical protein
LDNRDAMRISYNVVKLLLLPALRTLRLQEVAATSAAAMVDFGACRKPTMNLNSITPIYVLVLTKLYL